MYGILSRKFLHVKSQKNFILVSQPVGSGNRLKSFKSNRNLL